MTLLAFAAEHCAAAPLPVALGPAPLLSIDNSRQHGAQQQTAARRGSGRMMGQTDGRTDGRTAVSYRGLLLQTRSCVVHGVRAVSTKLQKLGPRVRKSADRSR